MGFELSKLFHLNAGVGVVVNIPVALVREASAAIKLALDPMRVEMCPVFRMFQMLVEDVHRSGHVKCVRHNQDMGIGRWLDIHLLREAGMLSFAAWLRRLYDPGAWCVSMCLYKPSCRLARID